MIDFSFLTSPLGILLQVIVAGALAMVLVVRSGPDPFKKKRGISLGPVWVAERVKPGEWLYDFKAKLQKTKEDELKLVCRDKREFIIPEEKKDKFERIIDRKSGKFARMFAIENGQVVTWNEKLAEQANPLLDHRTVTQYNNRTSARRLATANFGAPNSWLMLSLCVIAGLALGWIMEPMFVHQSPIIVTCTQLANGTMVPKSLYCP